MTFRHSIRLRIIMAYCLYGAVLALVFACVVYVSLDYIDDNLVNTRLVREMEQLGRKYEKNIDDLVPGSPNIRVYRGTGSMPEFAREMVDGISEGIHERYHGGVEFHIAVQTFANRIEPLFLFYDVSGLEFMESRKLRIGVVLATSVVLVVALGLWIGWLISRRVIAPVAYLADQVQRSGPDHLPTDLSANFYQDEVGALAKALEQAMARIQAFVRREQEFTRDTSHELRTPVTVIKGAVELLRRRTVSNDDRIQRPLKRIERAVANMENIIRNLLWLAREEGGETPQETCSAATVIQDAMEQLEQVMSEKSVSVVVNKTADPIVQAPAPIFRITFVNLIQNAFRHASRGEIRIDIDDDRIVIADSGEGIDPCDLPNLTSPYIRGHASTGFGLGLAIVERLCSRFGWRVEIQSRKGCGTTVTLLLHPGPRSTPAGLEKNAGSGENKATVR